MKTICMLITVLAMTGCAQPPATSRSSIMDAINAWANRNPRANSPTYDATILADGTIYVDIYGVIETNLQDSLAQELSTCPEAPSKIIFWKSETSWSVRSVTTRGPPSQSKQDTTQEQREKFIREIAVRK